MKLGSETGSVINHLFSRAVVGQPEPEVGMAATRLGWSDRYAATIVEVFQHGKHTFVAVQHDIAKVVAGSTQDGSAKYEYSRNPSAHKHIYRRENDGVWTPVFKDEDTKRWRKTCGAGLRIGEREEYRDPHF